MRMALIKKQLDENRMEVTNSGDAVVTIYEFRGTKFEKPITLKPGQSAVIRIKQTDEIIEKTVSMKDTVKGRRKSPVKRKKGE